MPNQNRDRVFVSYSHKDKEWLERFSAVLAPDIRNGRVDYWDDRELQPGDPWYAKILEGIGTARVAVLLVSPNFFASRFIMEEEVPRILAARNEGLTIVWIPLFGKFYGPDVPPEVKRITEAQAAFDAGKPLAEQDAASQTARMIDLCHFIQRLLNPNRIPSNLPFGSLAELFKGRNESLAQLDRSLRQHGAAAIVQPQAIHGLGGIGKTRLAIEYAWRHQNDFTAFLFVSANTPDDLDRNLSALCRPECLDLRESQSPKQEDQRDAVIRWLQENKNWLLILDNVDTDEGVRAVKTLVAKLRGGHVLITSRVTEWGRGVRPLALSVLPLEDAVALLIESAHSWRAPRPEDMAEGRTLAERLGCLPLALTHATAYMQHHHRSFTAYIDDFEQHFDRLLAYHDHLAIEYETELEEKSDKPATTEKKAARKKFVKTVATTFFLSFDRLTSEAKAILQAAAFLAPDPIPVAMFEECPDEVTMLVNLWYEETGTANSGQAIADALAELARYSLITRDEGVLSIHRMEQLVLRSRVAKDRTPKWIEAVRSVLCKYAPDENAENPQTWPVWDILRPHAEVLVSLAQADNRIEPHLTLMGALASLYYGKGLQYLDLAMEEAALQIAEQRNTPGSVALDVRFINYGESLYVLGRNSEAEAAFRRALTIREQADGPNSLEVAINLSYLANAVSAQGKTEQAESLLRRSIAIQESYGAAAKKHDIARSLNNLGTLLGKNGAYQEAEICLGKAIKLCEEGTDPDHPHTLTCVNQLARLFLKKGEHASAEPLFRRALAARERVLGPIHPNTLASVNDLADLLEATGRYQEATAMRQGSLEVQERSLGPENPDTLRSWNQHTYALRKQGLAEQAEPIDRRVAATTAKILGDNHPLAIHRRNNLVLTLIMLGKLEEARQILAANWRLNAPPHANTTLRIAFLRQLIALLESQPDTPFLGQLKTLLTGPELPVVTDVAVPWDIAYFIGHLRSQLPPGSADFLTALVAALNERAKVAELEGFPEWRNQPPVQLDAPWPD